MLLPRETFHRLCRARDVLGDVGGPAPKVDHLARRVGLSPSHFIRQFEATFGVTPHQFRMQRRIDRAKELLSRDDRRVTDVCVDVGFSSLGSFSSLFSRTVGLSPQAFRRRSRAMIVVSREQVLDPFPGCLSLMAYLPCEFDAVFEKQS